MSMGVVCPEGHPVLVEASRLGAAAICPRCFVSFLVEMHGASSWQARKEDSKARRPRDDDEDDDDDEEEERPRKKTKAKKADHADEEEDEEKPRAKKPSRQKEDVDEQEDEEEDTEEDEEDEEPIEWTPRKRQLNICAQGLIAMLVACYILLAFTVFTSIWIDLWEIFRADWAIDLFYWISLPLGYLGLTAFVVGMVFNLAVPGKAEAKGPLIGAIVMAGITYLLGLVALLTIFGVLVDDPARRERFVQLLNGGSIVCFFVCMISTMAYLAKLMVFMKLHLISSQSITNIGFILLAYALLVGLVYASPMLKTSVADWTCYIVAVVADAVTGYAIFMLVVHANLIAKVRHTIGRYIKEG